MSTQYRNFIDGEWINPRSGEFTPDRNPADTNDVLGEFPESSSCGCFRCGGRSQRRLCKLEAGSCTKESRNFDPCSRNPDPQKDRFCPGYDAAKWEKF